MTIKRRNPVCYAEYYLRHMEKLSKLSAEEKRFFWDQRSWHPVVKMVWNDEIQSDGSGTIRYPDGTTLQYQLDKRP